MPVLGRARLRLDSELSVLVRELSLRQLAPLLLAIAALFALLGPVIDILSAGHVPPATALADTVLSGVVAAGIAFGIMRHQWLVLLGSITGLFLWIALFGQDSGPAGRGGPPNVVQLRADGAAVILLMTLSYSSFLGFLNGTASRYIGMRAEITLAHQIHQVLVPPVQTRIGGYEFYGFSAASGEVGGDLVDVVPLDDGWFGHVADVSGHGVSSGVVMGMFKSALRMRLRQGGRLSALLGDLNVVLHPLKNSAMYVTLACVRGRDGQEELEYAVAGHLPILRVRAGTVDEITTPQVPIGMFETYAFSSATLACSPGDLLVLLTDGLIEVFDRADRELGLDAVKTLLASCNRRPLAAIADAIVATARAHGAQLDDQTLLLIRRVGDPAAEPALTAART